MNSVAIANATIDFLLTISNQRIHPMSVLRKDDNFKT